MTKIDRRRVMSVVRTEARNNRLHHQAERRVATGLPQSAKTWLLVYGISPVTAMRFAGAFSRSVTPESVTLVKIKLRPDSRRTKTVTVKRYDRTTVETRLAVYRPRDEVAAREFAAALH